MDCSHFLVLPVKLSLETAYIVFVMESVNGTQSSVVSQVKASKMYNYIFHYESLSWIMILSTVCSNGFPHIFSFYTDSSAKVVC